MPLRFSVVPADTVMVPVLEAMLPPNENVPPLASRKPSLVQLVPVMVMVFPAVSALMLPWLARPRLAEPTVPPCVPWISTLAPTSSVETAALVLTVLTKLVPPKMTSPVPRMDWVPLPSSSNWVLLPAEASVTLPPARASPPEAMLSVELLPTTTLAELALPLPSVTPVKVTLADTALVALVLLLVSSVPFWIAERSVSTRLPMLLAAPRS